MPLQAAADAATRDRLLGSRDIGLARCDISRTKDEPALFR
jgi:hypothetical protein